MVGGMGWWTVMVNVNTNLCQWHGNSLLELHRATCIYHHMIHISL